MTTRADHLAAENARLLALHVEHMAAVAVTPLYYVLHIPDAAYLMTVAALSFAIGLWAIAGAIREWERVIELNRLLAELEEMRAKINDS